MTKREELEIQLQRLQVIGAFAPLTSDEYQEVLSEIVALQTALGMCEEEATV
jgi:hypothetical protein